MNGRSRIRIALAGLGAVAQAVYLPLLARRRELFELVAICDMSPGLRDVVGDAHGLPPASRHGELGGMLDAGGIDAVVVLTSGSHGGAAAAVLKSGLAVLCEKPLAYTRDEADALRQATAGEATPRLLLGYMKQYDPAVRRCAEMLAGVERLRSVEVSVLHPAGAAQLEFANVVAPSGVDSGESAANAERESALRETALGPLAAHAGPLYSEVVLGSIVHDISLIRMLTGSPERIDHVDMWPGDSWPPSVSITGAVREGVGLSVRWHYLDAYPSYRETLSFHHERGTIELRFPSPYLLNAPTELEVADVRGGQECRSVHRSPTEAFEEQLLAFHAMVTEGAPPLSSIDEGRADIRTCQRIMRAYAEGAGLPVGGEAATA